MAIRLFSKFDLSKTVRNVRLSSHSASEHQKAQDLWKWASILIAFPSVAIAWWNSERQERLHPHKRPDFHPYDHLRLRTKAFPWGDGNHSLFHNPHSNALPDGYEMEEEHHGHGGHH